MYNMYVIPWNRETLFFTQKIHSNPAFPEVSFISAAEIPGEDFLHAVN